MTQADTRHSSPQALDRDNAKTWPRPFISRFLEPGLVSYEECGLGKELLRKETIDAYAQTFAGKPVIIRHSRVTPGNMEGKAVGYISRVWPDGTDGWFYCEGVITDDQAKALIADHGWSVSCSYHVKSTTPEGGKYHNIEYAREITAFEGEHLALVENPRYEEANIRLNEKPKETMNVFKVIMKKLGAGRDNVAPEDTVSEVPSESAVVMREGKAFKLTDLIAAHKEREASRQNAISLDAFVEIDGKQVAVKDLLPTEESRDNGEEKRDNKTVEDLGGRKGLRKVKNESDEEESEEDKKDNEKEEDKKGRDNSAFDALKNASQNAHFADDSVAISFNAMPDKVARGAERYGKK